MKQPRHFLWFFLGWKFSRVIMSEMAAMLTAKAWIWWRKDANDKRGPRTDDPSGNLVPTPAASDPIDDGANTFPSTTLTLTNSRPNTQIGRTTPTPPIAQVSCESDIPPSAPQQFLPIFEKTYFCFGTKPKVGNSKDLKILR